MAADQVDMRQENSANAAEADRKLKPDPKLREQDDIVRQPHRPLQREDAPTSVPAAASRDDDARHGKKDKSPENGE